MLSNRASWVLASLLLAGSVALALPGSASALDNQSCFDCHTLDLADMSAEDRAGMVTPTADGHVNSAADPAFLKIDQAAFGASVHGGLDCVNCHADITTVPHTARLAPVDCGQCHSDAKSAYETSIHCSCRADGNLKAATCVDCHGRHDITPHTDPKSRTHPFNLASTCGKCHLTLEDGAKKGPDGRMISPVESYADSTHALAISRGEENAATCNDCHESHALYPMADPKSSIFKMNVAKTCGKCHVSQAAEYTTSVHGAALAKGIFDAPTCSDCHGEHGVLAPNDPSSPVYKASVTISTCGDCHSQERLNRRFGISTERVSSYQDSFHGLAGRMGDTTVANCASCHGVHHILPSSDPASMIHPENLPKTCGSCHPKFGEAASIGPVHGVGDANGTSAKVDRWVRWTYYVLIFGTLGFMALHNFLDWLREIREKIKHRKSQKLYVRMDRNERWMHVLLLTSFITLAITGFMLVLNLQVPFVSGEFSQQLRAGGHRIAAVAFAIWAVWHAIYLIGSRRGRSWFLDMIPKFKDARDMRHVFRYYLGRESHPPRFERFTYVEKMEYWALLWGAFVMMATGGVLWFENLFASWLPFWGFDIVTLVHLFEAVLASAAIVIWHFYVVLYKTKPMAVWWITGTMTEEEMHHEHELELQRLKAAAAPKPAKKN